MQELVKPVTKVCMGLCHHMKMLRRILSPLPEPVKVPFRGLYHAMARVMVWCRERAGLPAPLQLVVCGYPRSGTSLLYNMLGATLPGLTFEPFERSALHSIQIKGSRASKSPMDVLELPRLASRNLWKKRVLVLICIRDPRDLVTSRHPMLPDRYFIGYDHSWWPGNKEFSEWKYDAPGIGEISRAIGAAEKLEGLNIYPVRFEQLVEQPDEVQHQIGCRFGLEFSGRFSGFHETSRRLPYQYTGRFGARDTALVREDKPVDCSRAGKWKASEHLDRIREQFDRHPELFGIVRQYGYETDDAWYPGSMDCGPR